MWYACYTSKWKVAALSGYTVDYGYIHTTRLAYKNLADMDNL